jgi:hypothetical protein
VSFISYPMDIKIRDEECGGENRLQRYMRKYQIDIFLS